MGKFIKSNFQTTCSQTGKEILEGDEVYYTPGRGTYHKDSELYKRELEEVQRQNKIPFNK